MPRLVLSTLTLDQLANMTVGDFGRMIVVLPAEDRTLRRASYASSPILRSIITSCAIKRSGYSDSPTLRRF